MYAVSQELNQFEKCHVIGQRAQQIAAGAPSTLTQEEITIYCNKMKGARFVPTALAIAELEYMQNKIPLAVLRKLPNGTEYLKKIYVSSVDTS